MPEQHRILITGANGYIGRQLFNALQQRFDQVSGIDVNCEGADERIQQMDIRDGQLADLIRQQQITHVVHLASIVQPGRFPEREYDIDVNGTQNVLDACLSSGVQHLTVTSSGAAYGYHADNPSWLRESDPLRGNDEFSYSRHKRLVEEMLAEARLQHPQLQQLILRPGTVLGARTRNMITRLFTGRSILALKGFDSPFVFIWDQDLARIIQQGVEQQQTGVFNVAGDGCVPIDQISQIVGTPLMRLPVWLVQAALTVGRALRLTQYGPEQIRFIQYRPVLANDQLKQTFGFTPSKTSREVLEYFVQHRTEPAE